MMSASERQRGPELYARLLRALPGVPEPILRFHASTRARGVFHVRTGSHPFAMAIVRLLGLPRSAERTPVELTIEEAGGRQTWTRRFGVLVGVPGDVPPKDPLGGQTERGGKRRVLSSHQREAEDHGLIERFGALELRFDLELDRQQLVYRQRQASLCPLGGQTRGALGRWRIRLPRGVSPVVRAHEAPCGRADAVHVAVDVRLPVVGLLFSYEGEISFSEETTA